MVCPSTTRWAAGIALLLVGMTGPANAAPSGRRPESGLERSQILIADGDAALERRELDVAIERYDAAYRVLDEHEHSWPMGSIPVRKAMQAYDLLAEREPGRDLLERELALLEQFLAGVAARPDGAQLVGEAVVDELEARRNAVKAKLSALAPEPALESTPAPEPEHASKPEREPEPIIGPDSNPQPPGIEPRAGEPYADLRPRPKVGMTLIATGGAVFGTGAGLLIGWWTVRNQAIDYANSERGYEEGTAAREWYLGREEDRARRYLVAGSVVMSVGVITAATGVGLIARHRRGRGKTTQLSLTPSFDGRHAALVAGGKF